MTVLPIPFVAACALLVVSGISTARQPGAARAALRGAGFSPSTAAVRGWAAVEVAAGAAALIVGGPLGAGVVGVVYAALAAFVASAVHRGPGATCGCFGVADTPATMLHAAIDSALALCAIAMAVSGWPGLPAVVVHQPLGGVPFVVVTADVAFLLRAAFSDLPVALATARGGVR